MYRYVFGPVLSSRLGRSLGLDLLGRKVCSMDCVYCEVGATRTLTLKRAPYADPDTILAELRAWVAEGLPGPDAVTLGGSGEPTLNTGLGAIIDGCREILPGVPVAVLTNSTLMTDPAVRAELARADAVLPSLDSLVEAEFQAVNRPCAGVRAADVARALLDFRKEFGGKIYLEILLADGINDSGANLALLEDYCQRLRPDRVDVVTLTRPGTVRSVGPVDPETLARWRRELGGTRGPVAAEAKAAHVTEERLSEAVQASLARRPQTVLQLAGALGAEPGLLRKVLDRLAGEGKISAAASGGQTFYSGPRDA